MRVNVNQNFLFKLWQVSILPDTIHFVLTAMRVIDGKQK